MRKVGGASNSFVVELQLVGERSISRRNIERDWCARIDDLTSGWDGDERVGPGGGNRLNATCEPSQETPIVARCRHQIVPSVAGGYGRKCVGGAGPRVNGIAPRPAGEIGICGNYEVAHRGG